MSEQEKLELLALIELRAQRANQRKIAQYYPDDGPLRRELYPKHLEFFRAGATYRERCFMAANRIGKTEGAGGYETALHLTGQYPSWWEGKTYPTNTRGWAAGKTNETTRDILQAKLFGPIAWKNGRKTVAGTGLVPADCIGAVTWKSGVQDMIDTIKVRHVTGAWSTLGMKSFQQGRGAFEGTEQDFVWLDEEPPLEIYGECLIRTATTNGIVYMTFTPLDGLTETVMTFLPSDGDIEKLAESAHA